MSATTSPAATLDFDHHGKVAAHDREQVLQSVVAHPIFWTEANGGHWVVTSYELTKAVLRDPAVFSSRKHEDGTGGVTIPTMVGPRLLPAEVDPPAHMRLRRILSPKFTRTSVEKVRPALETLIRGAVDKAVAKGEFDVVHDIANVIPAGTMVEYLGFPTSEREAFIASVQAALDVMPHAADPAWANSPELGAGMAALGHAVGVINGLIAQRRAEPTDDLVSHIAAPEHGLDDEEALWIIFTLLVGGAENPAAMLSNSLLYLSQDTALRRRLVENPELIPAACEELLRRITPGVSLGRNVIQDVELGGARLRAGDRLLLWLPGPNHDETVFPDPYTVDIDRPSCPHLAFGDGPHICPGTLLFRLQFQILLSEVLAKMPDYSIDLDRAERFDDAATMCGFRTMPARANVSGAA